MNANGEILSDSQLPLMSAEGMKACLRHRTPQLTRFCPRTMKPAGEFFSIETDDLSRRTPAGV